MNFVRPPFFLRWLYPQAVWHMSRKDRTIYLTFDDGPIPEITPWILDTLALYDAKATFFCVGENIDKHPEIFARIKKEGHQVGNHTYNHLKGWDHDDTLYLENIQRCQELTQTTLFRPPYLRATRQQLKELRKKFDIIYFDVLSCDYDTGISPERCYDNVINNIKNGSIVVFHDNIKAIPRLRHTLPLILKEMSQEGYLFSKL